MNDAVKASRSKRFVAVAAVAGFAALLASPVSAKTRNVAPPAQQDDADSQDSDLRLALDKVELDLDSGKLDEAQAILGKLNAKYPGNPEVLSAMADLNDRMSARSTSLSELCLPNSLEPNNNDILVRERVYGSAGANSACAGYNRRVTPEGYEQISSVTGQVAVLSPSMSLLYDLENDHLNSTAPFQRVNGAFASFYGARQQGTVTLQKTFQNHDQAGVSVFGNDTNAGGGLQYVERDRMGGTSIQANFNQPDWDYVEMVAQGGTKSNLHLERKQDILPNLQAVLGGGFTRYSLDNLFDAADAPGWNFGLDYSRPVKFFNQGPNDPSWLNDEITVGAHYGVEAEYFTSVNSRGRANVGFNPLPATTYEVHSFVGSLGKTLVRNVDAEVEGGYGIDRISGSSGPIYGGSLTYTPLQHLGVDVHAERTLLGGQNNSQKQDLAGASLKWSW